MTQPESPSSPRPEKSDGPSNDPAARALAEAQSRRRQLVESATPKEIDGRPGPDPIRYGDWENKGIACDF